MAVFGKIVFVFGNLSFGWSKIKNYRLTDFFNQI